ncbi:MAG TPA: flagella assembly protein FlgT middle domain-containing protein, partial [Cellvibrio sp.]|nr:flagella assembly protein FlgT middle domain-containing protein [Cellvibrio sp.]
PSPSLSTDNLLAQQIQKLARNQRTQLVLTGEIIDMTMTHPEATYNPGMYTRFLNGLFDFIEIRNRFDKRERVFSFNVNLRDGFTGQTLFSKRYDTYGVWGSTKDVGFDTPLFWKSDYGQQIKGLVKMAAKDVGAVVQCQPYIAQIDSRPGQTQILLQGGANNGLRSGDTLALYQMVVQGSETEYQQHQVRLVNRNAAIELREVYPSHSVGVISGTTYLTGQFLAVAQ